MNRKIIVLGLCLLFILTFFPITKSSGSNLVTTYTDCTIVSSGTMTNRLAIGLFKLGNKAFIIYMNMGYKEDGVTSLYNENGDLLWHYQGEHSMILLFFRGNYSSVKDPDTGAVFVAMDGLVIIARV